MDFDYKKLLTKYLAHVLHEESVHYIDRCTRGHIPFSPNEIMTLYALAREGEWEYNKFLDRDHQ